MSAFVITLDGDRDDIEFIRTRAVAAVEELVDEYADNLDGDVEVSWEWDD